MVIWETFEAAGEGRGWAFVGGRHIVSFILLTSTCKQGKYPSLLVKYGFKTPFSSNDIILTKGISNQLQQDTSLQQMLEIVVRRDHSFRGHYRLTCGGGRAFVPPGDNVVSHWTLKLLGLALWSSTSISVCPLFFERNKGSTSVCNSASQVLSTGFPESFSSKNPSNILKCAEFWKIFL